MLILAALTGLAALAWLYLITCHGGYWLTGQRLPDLGLPDQGLPDLHPPDLHPPDLRLPDQHGPRVSAAPPRWPSVTAVVPARDEATMLPVTLPTLLGQDYPGEFEVIVVDDGSSDGTAETAERLGAGAARKLRVIAGSPPPDGWAGKVWAMAQGAVLAQDTGQAGRADYLLFTDADIAYRPGTLSALVGAAEGDDRELVSQMALLRATSPWERVVVPAFVYFFAQLYPFRRVNRPGGRTAAAAGGCMLIRREALEASGGLAGIRGARIDDVALGRQIKRHRPGGRGWLGLTTDVTSERPYPGLASLWHMVARSAYTQLRHSPLLLAGTIVGLLWLYLLPPAAAVAGLAVLASGGLAAGGGASAAWCAGAGLAGWALMTVSFAPVLRLYRLSLLRAPTLPLIATLYAAMTFDSARRHYAGRGGEWKGRLSPQPRPQSGPRR